MDSSPARDPRFTLFATILTLFVSATLLVSAGVTVTDYVQNRRNAIRIATDSFKEKLSRINERRHAFFASPFLIVQQFRDDAIFRQPTGSKEAILKVILSSLTLNPQISAIYAGYENGNYFQVLSISDAEKSFIGRLGGPATTRFAVEEIHTENGARVVSFKFLDAGGQQIGMVGDQAATYDPRQRDWYRDARAQPQKLVRTAPYLFATTSKVGMTLARAFDGGAIGVDMTLDRLMAYVQSVRSNENQRFVEFDDQNRLLAHFDPDKMFKVSGVGEARKVELATTSDLADPVVREALKSFLQRGPYQSATLNVAGSQYIATVERQIARDGGTLFVLYAAPLSDFMGPLTHAAARSLLAALLIFVVALPAIIFLAHSISKPLSKLSEEAKLIQAFQLAGPIKLDSRVREVNTLIGSMSNMKGTIREVSKFVPKALVRELLQSGGAVEVGGVTRRVSILFSDIRDFTHIAEGMPPENLMISLSEYFEELASLIIKEGGTVDKFIGDAIFAFWNAPLPVERHEYLACATALKARAALRRLNERWAKEGLVPWHTRMGVHVGEAVLGNVGSSDRIDYTAIGDTVNIASRLEALNKFYGTGILASGEIVDACSTQFLFRRVDRGQPKGAGKPLDIFELLGMLEGPEECRVSVEMVRLVRDWNRIYELYACKDWQRMQDALRAFTAEHPDDVVAGLYLSRVSGFLRESPPDDWDGIIHFSRK